MEEDPLLATMYVYMPTIDWHPEHVYTDSIIDVLRMFNFVDLPIRHIAMSEHSDMMSMMMTKMMMNLKLIMKILQVTHIVIMRPVYMMKIMRIEFELIPSTRNSH